MSLYDIKKKLEILELFKKSSSAMKLVSLSMHHTLKKIITEFKHKFESSNHILENYFYISSIPSEKTPDKKAFIFISSDRGFCGDYVNLILIEFKKTYETYKDSAYYIIIGKMLIQKIQSNQYKSPKIIEFSSFKIDKFNNLYQNINNILKQKQINTVVAYYTQSINISNRIIKTHSFNCNINCYNIKNNFSIGHCNKNDIIISFFKYYIESFIFNIFYQSLYSEQGARFIAMDAALRNANESILKNQKLYFKIRQNKINNQLQDLVSSLL